jgi:nucleoside 2-deoxyribosyltransferase
MKLYIAHPMGLRHRVRDNICPAITVLGIETINPFYNIDGSYREDRPEIKAIDGGRIGEYDIHRTSQAENIVMRDLYKIREADGLVAIFDDNTAMIGTSMEIFYCARVCKKPVFIVTVKYSKHPWLLYLSSRTGGAVVETVEELLKVLKKCSRYITQVQ